MNLEEFIKESISNIIRGVECSQKELENTNAVINPSIINEKGFIDYSGKRKVIDVRFDVAVTVEDIDEGKKGFRIAVADIISLGAKSQEKTANQVISRIAFEIPLLLPIKDKLTEEANEISNRDLNVLAGMV
ncbi:hypothetical protein [Capnocytophaga gingivalis]|jgi:hypothetical protein|uniref:hypothetical protein n=1 Tax=Capnocytophaga gingivalis TaxID=1017 RepID=UPI00235403DD|nr:hypothetical protein [Capnocytophaga gingivalis]